MHMKSYQAVPRRTIRRREMPEIPEAFAALRSMLELCRESDDALWRQLLLLRLEDLEILRSAEGKHLKYEIRRKLE